MNKRYRRREVFLSMLVTIAMLSMGCRLTALQVPTVTPKVVPSPTLSLVPAPTGTPFNLPTSTNPPNPDSTSGPFRMVNPVDEVLSGTFEALVSTADGTVWLITELGVARLVESTWTATLTSFSGKIAGIDSIGRVWVVNADATQISAWKGQAWIHYGVDAGWTPLTDGTYKNVRGGQSDLLGRIWFGTSQDVRVFDGNRWTVYTPQEMGMEPSMNGDDIETRFEVTVLRSGMVWVSECDWGGPGPFGGQGIRWFDKGAWQGASSPVDSGCAIAIADDSIGHVWAGVDRTLWRYDPASGEWIASTPPESPIAEMHFRFIDSLIVDPHDTVWPVLVLCGGASCYGNSVLYHFHDELWTQVGEVGEFDAGYWGPIFDAEGMPWLYWDGGIYQIKGEVPELVSPLAGRFGSMDQSGRLWFVVSNRGRDTLWVLDDETSK